MLNIIYPLTIIATTISGIFLLTDQTSLALKSGAIALSGAVALNSEFVNCLEDSNLQQCTYKMLSGEQQ